MIPDRKSIRVDLQLIADMIEPHSRVLDVGCGDGTLLDYLVNFRHVDGRGIELSSEGVKASISAGLSVIQGDADTDLKDYPDDAFDYVGDLHSRSGEAGLPLWLARVVELANHDEDGDTDAGADAGKFIPEMPCERVAEDRPREFGVERLAVGLEPQQESAEEADHDEPVRPADCAELGHARVHDEFDHHLLEARDERA